MAEDADQLRAKWLESESLGGTGAFGLPNGPVGVNGISFRDGTIFANLTERLSIVSIPVLDDGSPGQPATIAEGVIPDGMALDTQGRIYIADVGGSAVKRLNADGTIEVLAEGAAAGLDLNASVAFGIGGTELTLYTVNLAGIPGAGNGVGPALVAIDVDTSGQLPPR